MALFASTPSQPLQRHFQHTRHLTLEHVVGEGSACRIPTGAKALEALFPRASWLAIHRARLQLTSHALPGHRSLLHQVRGATPFASIALWSVAAKALRFELQHIVMPSAILMSTRVHDKRCFDEPVWGTCIGPCYPGPWM